MSAPNIIFMYNNSQNNVPNTGGAAGDINWKIMDAVNDYFTFLSENVEDGDANTTKSIFYAPESGSKEISRVFVNDYLEGKWKRIWLAGSNADGGSGGNYKYAFGAYIDGTSQSPPILQAWDSESRETYDLTILGSGVPSNSLLRAICTTYFFPGDEWEGTPIAGSGSENSIALFRDSITQSRMVYWNMRVLVPSTISGFSDRPILCIYTTYS